MGEQELPPWLKEQVARLQQLTTEFAGNYDAKATSRS